MGYGRQSYNGGFSRFGLNYRLTPGVKWLLIANGVVFLLELIIGRIGEESLGGMTAGLRFLYYDLSISFEHFFFKGKLWQAITYMFLHDPNSIGHIFWNMLMLWMFGSPLESFWRTRGFMRFYFLCGLGAAAMILFVGLMVPSQRMIPTMGASGALYGMLVAFGFMFPNSIIYLFGLFPLKGKHLVMLFVGVGIIQSLTLGGTNVSLSAHFGGMLSGFLLVTGFWKPVKVFNAIKMWRMKRRYRKLKSRMRIVDRDDDSSGGYFH
jgi:membrane associated rhomboid family serine protease